MILDLSNELVLHLHEFTFVLKMKEDDTNLALVLGMIDALMVTVVNLITFKKKSISSFKNCRL